jgi:four helix bundle protein
VRSAFRELAAYQLALAMSHRVYAGVRRWESFELWSVGLQLVRSADSVPANIAEASGRQSAPDQRRFLIVAWSSLHETEHWLGVARKRGFGIDPAPELDEVARTLSGLIKRARAT